MSLYKSWSAKIQRALKASDRVFGRLPRIAEDLKRSQDVVCQLHTIVQGQLALKAELNNKAILVYNKAILVFTIVTIAFLPLSFFTSNFGMTLRGTAQTDRPKGYFWAVCASITFIVIITNIGFGFKNRLYDWLWVRKQTQYLRANDP